MSDNPSDDTPTVDPLPPLGDMDPAEFRRAGHQLVDWISRYLENSEQYPVLSRARPGQSRDALPTTAPIVGEEWDQIFADVDRLIVPGLTHWNHQDFSLISQLAVAAQECWLNSCAQRSMHRACCGAPPQW